MPVPHCSHSFTSLLQECVYYGQYAIKTVQFLVSVCKTFGLSTPLGGNFNP